MTVSLSAQSRPNEHRSVTKALRLDRKIPAVIYGPEMEPISIAVEYNTFEKTLATAGESTLVEIDIAGGDKHNVLIKDIQVAPMSGKFTHVDFYAVSMKKELETDVHLNFVGESLAVKTGGTLVKVKDSLEVRCLPKDLVRGIDVSIESLKTYDDVITVADITLPAGLTAVADGEDVVAKVSAALTEDQLKALEAENAGDVTKIEVVGKKEEEPAADADAAKKEVKKDAKK
ncbi:MAG: 50S ribosomal protein L25 [Candidatus Magasanikbacteria bacterium]|nr:50S ribosomal protein L25 [Candidatus Magasanikbacteria bacterium]